MTYFDVKQAKEKRVKLTMAVEGAQTYIFYTLDHIHLDVTFHNRYPLKGFMKRETYYHEEKVSFQFSLRQSRC